MGKSNIDYLTDTWSPISGCSGKGCKVRDNCWAKRTVNRFAVIHGWEINQSGERLLEVPIPFNQVRFHPDRLDKPLHWKKPRRIGVAFCGDWMDDQVKPAWIDQILEVIAACPQHQFFSLTKQAQNLEPKIYGFDEACPARELGGGDYLPNLWNGVSITDQEDADRMIPELLRIPGKHWISYEPALGPIRFLYKWLSDSKRHPKTLELGSPSQTLDGGSDWFVLGCESGPKHRPCPQSWMIDVVRQCQAAGVKCYVKQIQRITDNKVVHDINLFPFELQVRELP